jgi:outer membrane receptor protein involved in Fe transport
MNPTAPRMALTLLAASLLAAFGAHAQTPTPPAASAQRPASPPAETRAEGKDSAEAGETVVVTGTATLRAGFATPLSVTALGASDLQRLSANSQADILATLPGIKAEGGGGEVASNVQVRGLPSSGQYQFTPLLYDGLPALSTFGLNSSAYDVYIRNDLGVRRLEFVAGGVSNLFGPGSVAGLLNYISKTGGTRHEGTLQLELSDKGRMRTDAAFSGPLGERTSYAVSGYWRKDDGPLKSGLPSEGGQLRANLVHQLERGSIKLFGQLIDDRVQFFLPLPLDGQSLERVNGADGRTVYTANTAQAAGLTSILPGGKVYRSPIADGVSTQGGSLALVFDHDLPGEMALNIKAKAANYRHGFHLFSDGDGIVNVPETQAQYLTNRGIAGPATFTYVDNGQPLAAGTRLFANRITNRDRPATDASAEFNLTKRLQAGGVTHNLTLGSWLARTTAEDNTLTQTYLAEFANQPRLVNLVAGGVNHTRNGLLAPSVGYTQNTHKATRTAFYLADQIEARQWAFDAGVRVERIEATLQRERTTTVTGVSQGGVNESATLNRAVVGNGTYLSGKVSTTETAAAVGALYKLDRNTNLYGNVSRGFFFPEVRSVAFNAAGQPSSYEGEIIDQAEFGVKHAAGRFTGTAAVFTSTLKNRRSVTFQNTTGGGIAEVVTLLSTKTTGVEANAVYRILPTLTASANLTLSDHEITDGVFAGKELERKPKTFANAALNYDDGRFDGSVSVNYQSRAFSNNANSAVLPSYSLWRLTAGYKMRLASEQSLRLGLSVFNLTDSQGLAEGSPRLGATQVTGGQFFVGRPILPRRVSLTATYSF